MTQIEEVGSGYILNPTVTFDPMVSQYFNFFGILDAEYFNGWEAETVSWKKTCYLAANLSYAMNMHTVKGPDATKLMNEWFVNNFSTMKPGQVRHGIMVTSKGHVIEHGVVLKFADDEYGLYGFQPYINWIANTMGYDVEEVVTERHDFIFQLGGPKSLEIIEHAAQADFHDLKFLRFCDCEIAGHKIRLVRQGMAGTLSYELHGPWEVAQDVYAKIIEVGADYGLEKLGLQSYLCNHSENGFPQIGQHFPYPFAEEPEFCKYLAEIGFWADPTKMPLLGSVGGSLDNYYRNPFELGGGHMVKFDNDFHGKEALEKIAEDHREMVTLEWDPEDLTKVFQSQFTDEPFKRIDFPYDHRTGGYGNNQDRVVDSEGNQIGNSMWPVYTIYYHKMISICSIDPAFATEGTEVQVVWGDCGQRQINIRAKVARFPYLDLPANQNYDMDSIPRFDA